MNFAQLTLIGNVGRDPDLSYTPEGVAGTRFSLAVNKKEGKDGPEKTIWFACTAFRGLADAIVAHVSKGDPLFVQGEFHPRSYTDKERVQRTAWMCWWRSFTCWGAGPRRLRKPPHPPRNNNKRPFHTHKTAEGRW